MLPQQYCLRWKHHHSNVQSMFAQLLEKERFCDVTLYCSPSFASQVDGCDLVHPANIKGVSLRAHRVVLAACSELLGSLLGAHEASGEPVLVIDGACPSHVRALLAYMYTGEMSVHHSQLPSLLKTAEELKIKGLTDIRWSNKDEPPDTQAGSVTATHTNARSDHHAVSAGSKPDRPDYHTVSAGSKPDRPDYHTVSAGSKPDRPDYHTVSTGSKPDRPDYHAVSAGSKPDRPDHHAVFAGSKPDRPDYHAVSAGSKPDRPDHHAVFAGSKPDRPDYHAVSAGSKLDRPDMKTYARSKAEAEAALQMLSEVKSEDKYSINGGPPPLIKLPTKEKNTEMSSPTLKRELLSDTDTHSPIPKRQRIPSGGPDHPEDFEEAIDQEWRHGNLDISAERVARWPGDDVTRDDVSWDGDAADSEEWGDAPADIGSFLHTRLTVDGDNSCEDSNDGAPPSTSSSVSTAAVDLPKKQAQNNKPTVGPKSGPTDPRFTDVIKLNDYLRHGRRPQFWEEDYVRRVMEAIRMKELEMKQAAEILGVSYGTLYGRYRDAFGCINRPFRSALNPTTRDFWSTKGSAEVLSRLKRGEIPMDLAAQALGVSARDLYVHYSELHAQEKEFEPIPIEIDPSLQMKSPSIKKKAGLDEEPQPSRARSPAASAGRWRLALDNLRSPTSCTSPAPAEPGASTSPTLLMRSRPDLTIVAARKQDATPAEAENGT